MKKIEKRSMQPLLMKQYDAYHRTSHNKQPMFRQIYHQIKLHYNIYVYLDSIEHDWIANHFPNNNRYKG